LITVYLDFPRDLEDVNKQTLSNYERSKNLKHIFPFCIPKKVKIITIRKIY